MRMCLQAAMTLVLVSAMARAGELFEITADATSGGALSRTVSGKGMLDLVDNLINASGGFSAFDGRAFDASLKYAGVPNAVRLEASADGRTVTLSIPSTGFSKTFSGSSRSDVESQIEDFLKKDGLDQWGKFLAKMNELSIVAVNDGNPQALTASLATEAFRRFAQRPNLWHQPNTMGGERELRIDISAASIATDHGDGWAANITLTSSYELSNSLSLSIGLPLMYRDIEGSIVYMAGLDLGLPIRLIRGGPNEVSWQLTPFFTGGVAASEDFVAGGVILGGGVASLLGIPLADDLMLTIGNQISLHEGLPVSVSDYRFDPEVSQQILKNGAQLSWGRDWQLTVGATHTQFLQEAAVDNYVTLSAGVNVRLGKSSGAMLSYNGDFGDGYKSHGASLLIYLGL